MGRPAYEATQQDRWDVERWTQHGASQREVAEALDISEDTLRKYFAAELKASNRKFNLNLATSFKARAMDSSQPAAIAVAAVKMLLGWRELTAKDPDRKTVEDMTNDELAAIVSERTRAERERSSRGDSETPTPRRVAA